LLYLLSGGVSFKQLLPDITYSLVNWLDRSLPKIVPGFSMFTRIELVKRSAED
jgi:muramoyltetrapeptide carboxypeptidase LdcA involved in peptidoglycan recycling